MRVMSLDRRCVVAGACLALLVAVMLQVPRARAGDFLVEDRITEDEAVALVREKAVGKVVRVDRKTDGESAFYRIRVLTPDGRLREYRVDAATGTLR